MAETPRGNGLRHLCLALAIPTLGLGVVMGMAAVALALEGDSIALAVLGPYVAVTIADGVVLLVARNRLGTQEDELERLQAAATRATATSSTQQHQQVAPPIVTPAVATRPVETRSDPTPPDETKEIASMVVRSEDVMATLRDLARHDLAKESASDNHHLSTMLRATGLLDWQEAPVTEGGLLSRNKHFWLRRDTSEMDDDAYDRFVAIEAALNIAQDTPHLGRLDYDDPRALEGILLVMRGMCDQQISPSPLMEEGLRCAYHSLDADITPGEWAARSSLVSAAECARTFFRVVYQIQACLEHGVVVVDLEIPRPRCFAVVSDLPSCRTSTARAYALRLATLMARHALAAHRCVERVVVNCHERGGSCCLSLDVSTTTLAQLLAIARDERLETGFPSDASIRVSFDDDGWFAPLEDGPFLDAGDPVVFPTIRNTFPELVSKPASDAFVRTTGAATIADIGINENAGRVAAWHALYPRLGSTTEHAVQVLMQARNEAEDITVVEACNRTIQELVSGESDPDDLERLAHVFVDGAALDVALARANELLDEQGPHPDPEGAVHILTEALAPIDEMGAYLDDADTVYRYFGSVAERVRHNLQIDEGGRQIRLVPDAYFNAHAQLSVALDLLDRNEEALEHAEVCLRLAPTSTYAVMRKVRVLEHRSSIYEAEALIRGNLPVATTPRDAAICHYRLAYMEWKLGREDLAVACYQRALTWDTEVRASAREELDDLLSASKTLHALEEHEVASVLEKAGIPLGCDTNARNQILAAAVACIDEDAFLSAAPLLGSLFAAESDDVVMGVYRSLKDWS